MHMLITEYCVLSNEYTCVLIITRAGVCLSDLMFTLFVWFIAYSIYLIYYLLCLSYLLFCLLCLSGLLFTRFIWFIIVYLYKYLQLVNFCFIDSWYCATLSEWDVANNVLLSGLILFNCQGWYFATLSE